MDNSQCADSLFKLFEDISDNAMDISAVMGNSQCADSLFKQFEDISDNAIDIPTTSIKKRKTQQKANTTLKPDNAMDIPTTVSTAPTSIKKRKTKQKENTKLKPDNAMDIPTTVCTAPTSIKKRKTQQKANTTLKPGWVPKATEDSPIVSWLENEKIFTVQNPANKGSILLKLEFFDDSILNFMCGFYMDKNSDMHKTVNQLLENISNLWIERSTGVPKIPGLTQTVQSREAIVTNTITVKQQPKRRKSEHIPSRTPTHSKQSQSS